MMMKGFGPCRFLICIAVSLVVVSARAQQEVDLLHTGHFFFGDSTTDNGNLYAVTGGTTPPSPPYNQRFTNGLVYAEYLVPGLQRITLPPTNLHEIDFAFGGATAAPAANPPGFAQQIGLFSGLGQTIQAHDLVGVSFGMNDFFNAVAIPANQNPTAITNVANAAVGNVNTGVQSLIGHGGRQFVVFYLPDLSETPAFRSSPSVSLADCILRRSTQVCALR